MPILPRRFERLKQVLNSRMSNLTVLLEDVEKPHNLSAIIRSCDAVGVLEAHAVFKGNQIPTFNSTAQGSQKWVNIHNHNSIESGIKSLKEVGFKLYGTCLKEDSHDYLSCDFTGPTAFVLGAEKWGLSEKASELMDQMIFIPMRGMVQSLNVSVAAATLLFEALRQRKTAGLTPTEGGGIKKELYDQILFEWAYPEVANWCKDKKRSYPKINNEGEIIEDLPRSMKMKF